MKERTGTIVRTVIIVTLLLSSALIVFGTNSVVADQEGDYTYTMEGSPTVANITGYTGAGGVITIPSTLGGYPVVAIGDSAFISITSLTSVTIPNGVNYIGELAFASCPSLTSVTIPNGVTGIGIAAFASCPSLTSVTIPNGVTTIGDGLFDSCTSMASVTIPDSVTSIGRWAFQSCTSLTSAVIPNSVTTIGKMAFFSCTSLTSLTIGSGVTSIGESTFSECSSLASVTIPNGVTGIEYAAFASCTSLTSVTIESGVISIGFAAFASCTSLTSVTIPDSVTSIGERAFESCTSLTSVTIGIGVTTIDYYAFQSCTSLTSAVIPNSVTAIGGGAFQSCTSLTSMVIPNSVTYFGEFAFASCTSLASVTIGSGITFIGEETFASCTSLTSVTIPDSVTHFGERAFQNCTSLASVTIPINVTYIGDYEFGECTSLTSVFFLGSVAPTLVHSNWLDMTPNGIRGHAYAASDFPGPGGIWNGLTMGTVIPVEPGAPLGLVATPGNAQVVLNWTVPSNNGGSTIDYYVIYQDGIALAGHKVNLTAVIQGLSNGHEYNFTVAAHNLVGEGEQSIAASSIPYTVPDAPMGLEGKLGDGQVTLNWNAPVFNGGRGIDHYTVYQDGVALPVHLTDPSTIIGGLVNGQTYSFTVSAHNLAGIGPQSTAVTVTPSPAPTVPGAPAGLSATPRNGQVSLSWSEPSSNGGGAIDFYIIYQNGTDIAHPTSTSMTVSGLINGVSYSYSVAAHNIAGTGPQSSSISAIPVALTTVLTVPDPPTGLTATPGDSQVSISWSAPGSDGGATIDYYLVYVNGVARSDHYTTVSTTINGLTNGQQYTFTVAAHNSVGFGTQSTPNAATPSSVPTVPGAPTGIGAVPGNGQVSLSWMAPSNNGGAVIDYYLVYVNGIVISDHFSTTSTMINGLVNGQQYSFTIVAHNSVGASAQSSAIAATPSSVNDVPGVPIGLTATPGNGQITLSWAAPTTNGGADIDYYIVYQDGIDISHPLAALETISSLTNGQSYDFTVAAHNSIGTGIQTTVVTAIPSSGSSVPGIPTDLIATAGVGEVSLSWAAPAGSTGIDYYIVYQNGVDVIHTSVTSTTITGLTNGEHYSFAVAAHNLRGMGAQSLTETTSPSASNSNNGATASSGNDSMPYLPVLLALSLAGIIAGFLLLNGKRKKEQ